MFTPDVLNDSVDQFNAVRLDKPCGNSYIPQNAKCQKGAGQAKGRAKTGGANSPEKWGGESVQAKGAYAKFLKNKGIDPSKLGANSPKAEKLAMEYFKTPEGKNELGARSQKSKQVKKKRGGAGKGLKKAGKAAAELGILAGSIGASALLSRRLLRKYNL